MADQRTDKAPKRFIFFFLFYCKKFWYTCMYILYLTSQLIFSKNAFPNHHLAYFTIFDCSISRTLYLIYIKSLCHNHLLVYNSIWLNCIQYKFEKKTCGYWQSRSCFEGGWKSTLSMQNYMYIVHVAQCSPHHLG